ncbi:MAG: hypothetical protein LBT36_01820 [Oscillospiraceae bacterium]|jgi:hypothetical protein|nr:hypothetical protein [Oscillospiraceae bacterium]
MFGTFERFNLVRAAFGRNGSNTFVAEDFNRAGQLILGNNYRGDALNTSDFLFDLKLLINGTPVKYTYFADEGSIKLTHGAVSAEIALTARQHFRVKGRGAGLRLELRSASGGGARALGGIFSLPDASGWEGSFGRFGKLKFVSVAGAYTVAAPYDDAKGQYASLRIDFVPDAQSGEFDAAVHDYQDAIRPFGEYECFDALVADNRRDFAEFAAIYRDPLPEYAEISKYAKWTVWSHRSAPIGTFKQPHILFQNAWSCAAAPWQQSYNAMPMLQNPAEAWRQICLMFLYQNERTGQVPNMITYGGAPADGMQPAFQGFALDFILRNVGDGFITESEAARMYPKMAKWVNYWTTYRSAHSELGEDVTFVTSPHESGWDDSSMFQDGFPAIEPNTLAFLVLLMECVGLLGKKSGKPEAEVAEWYARAQKLTDILVTKFWNGEKFITYNKSGGVVDAPSLACYQAIILGKRLPREIIDKVAEKLTEDGQWLTEIGLASENVNSPFATFGISFVCGRVVGPQNMILTVGLQNAGKQAEAELIARRFCDHVAREGVVLGYAPYNYHKRDGSLAEQQSANSMMDGWPWSSWTANCFLTMSTAVIGA